MFMGALYPPTAEAGWPSIPSRIPSVPPRPTGSSAATEPDTKPGCLQVLAGPKVPSPSGHFDSLESLNHFIDDDGIELWARESQTENGDSRTAPAHFVRLIGEYRASVNRILLNEILHREEILKILYYNIASVSRGVIPTELARENLEVNHFLTDQLGLLRDFLGKEIVFYLEEIRKNPREHAARNAPPRNFVETFQNIISPLLHPKFGIRIVFQTCHLLYDLMLEQKYFQVAKTKVHLSLHELLQDTLLRTGTHPYILIYFWEKEPRLLMDQDFPADGFWVHRSGVFARPYESKDGIKSLVQKGLASRNSEANIFEWAKYDSFDPTFELRFVSAKNNDKFQLRNGKTVNFLNHIKSEILDLAVALAQALHSTSNWAFSKGPSIGNQSLDASEIEGHQLFEDIAYFNPQLQNGMAFSTLSGHASTLSFFLLRAADHKRLLKFSLRDSADHPVADIEFLDDVRSMNSYSDRSNRRQPTLRHAITGKLSNFLPSKLAGRLLNSLRKVEDEPLRLEQDAARSNAAGTSYKTPALPNIRVAIDQNIFPADGDSSQVEVRKLGAISKKLAQEIEGIYSWVMDENFGVGNVIGYSRGWLEIAPMINPDHLDEVIARLIYDLTLLEDIQNRMTTNASLGKISEPENSQIGKPSPIDPIEKISQFFLQSTLGNLLSFTKSLVQNLQVIQYALAVHPPKHVGSSPFGGY
jgi:hypothetical protein